MQQDATSIQQNKTGSDRINKREQIHYFFYIGNGFQQGLIPFQSKGDVLPSALSLLSFPSVVTGIISQSLHSKAATWKIQSHFLLIPRDNIPIQAKPKRKSHHKTAFHNPLNILPSHTISASSFADSKQILDILICACTKEFSGKSWTSLWCPFRYTYTSGYSPWQSRELLLISCFSKTEKVSHWGQTWWEKKDIRFSCEREAIGTRLSKQNLKYGKILLFKRECTFCIN